ncbi:MULTISPECIES: hypothetical protein [Massilia]|uniref:Uncharacterized protein n=1 Tax=Massilia timonae TaxID=47229 RepID=A0A1S2N708_9BURK|nr:MULTISPECIES: hypothetical protein [Massilia]OIJ40867.1 hypothetical protein LO55_3262 [Massilia timonae]
MANEKFESGDINILGNGNAVGNRIRVTNVSKTVIHNRGGSGGPGGAGGGGNDREDGAAVLGLGLGALVALAALSFWFARYSDLIYSLLTVLSITNGGLGLIAAVRQIYIDDYMEALRSMAVALIGILTFFIVGTAEDTMPKDLAMLAQSGTFQSFWCGLSVYGQQVASQHSVLGTLLLVPLGILTLLQSWRAFVVAVCAEDELPDWVDSFFNFISGDRQFFAMCIICAIAVVGHSQIGDEFWKEHFSSRVDFFCGVK